MGLPGSEASDELVKNIRRVIDELPMREETKKLRRNFMALSVLTFLASQKALPYIDKLINRPNEFKLFVGALFIGVIYYIAAFIISIRLDMRRWTYCNNIALRLHNEKTFIDVNESIEKIAPHLDKINNAGSPGIQDIDLTILKGRLKSIEAEFVSAKWLAASIRRLNFIKLYVIDIGIPFLLGTIALIFSYESLTTVWHKITTHGYCLLFGIVVTIVIVFSMHRSFKYIDVKKSE